VGLIPLNAMLEAGRYFLHKQNRSSGLPDSEILKMAIMSLGLNDVSHFDPKKKIIEYILEEQSEKRLIDLDLEDFAYETASESPAPGGGSIAAYLGAMGVSLAAMVANLSSHKAGWDNRWKEFSDYAEKAMKIQKDLLMLVDEDTKAFNHVMEALGMPKNTDAEKASRHNALQAATRFAIEIPLKVMKRSFESFEILKAMAETGNPNSVSDAGVGALCARSAVMGAYLNVKINASGLEDKLYRQTVVAEGREIELASIKAEQDILRIVSEKMA
jgi:glutamate formiminotransferase / formiminotetrahydrofolate cyclodeaminase